MHRALRTAVKRFPGLNRLIADRDRWRDAFAEAEIIVADLVEERVELREALAAARLDPEAWQPAYVAAKAPGGAERQWAEFAAACREFGGLTASSAVLDVGCGVGGVAQRLTRVLGPAGRYEGVDVDARAIAVCNATIDAPYFRFAALDVQHEIYNVRGSIEPTEVVLPYDQASFDLVVARSLFTHLYPPAVARYVAEMRRVLRPGGRAVVTAFLLNDEVEARLASGEQRSARTFAHDRGDYRIDNPISPLNAVAYREPFLRELLPGANLEVVAIRYGRWSGATGSSLHQDLIVAEAGTGS